MIFPFANSLVVKTAFEKLCGNNQVVSMIATSQYEDEERIFSFPLVEFAFVNMNPVMSHVQSDILAFHLNILARQHAFLVSRNSHQIASNVNPWKENIHLLVFQMQP
jgi:hypothetical protein